ncbi:hypothetical protein DL766_003549 [Monosporascus sp. MC13-8B]|uniref:LysM domain-containing protein n=1 Tax=Monosporascus cannonballus TaxID=155416 RepID=A0ABY0HAU3_9PEZI|nr:hypothetical protein DL762_004397 [Monosporascus cannonballus]RYO95758.1 hypothetical protein DL763_003538 [Monosporascus cannonballus]RYP33244.1 hypothetical protein DL766_003549 [Monosporascus sp. MC13-8B]
MSSSSNMSCPVGEVPEALSIPQNITYAVIPGQNISAMATCCLPNPVHVVDGCWEWCQIPSAIAGDSDSGGIMLDFGNCLNVNGRNISQSNGLAIHMASSARPNHGVTLTGLALVAVAALRMLI